MFVTRIKCEGLVTEHAIEIHSIQEKNSELLKNLDEANNQIDGLLDERADALDAQDRQVQDNVEGTIFPQKIYSLGL